MSRYVDRAISLLDVSRKMYVDGQDKTDVGNEDNSHDDQAPSDIE